MSQLGRRIVTRTRSAITLVASAILAAMSGLQLWTTSRSDAAGTPSSSRMPPSPTSASSPEPLPSPRTEGDLSLEEAIANRRSVREFAATPLTEAEISQLLWAAQGVTDSRGHRSAPSAGALYPLEVYAVTARGTSRYLPAEHALATVDTSDLRSKLRDAALGQQAVGNAALVLVFTAVPDRMTWRYRDRTTRYVQLEAGHAAQNVLLEAVALGLGAVPIGAFDDSRVGAILHLPAGEVPLYMIAVGHAALPDSTGSRAERPG